MFIGISQSAGKKRNANQSPQYDSSSISDQGRKGPKEGNDLYATMPLKKNNFMLTHKNQTKDTKWSKPPVKRLPEPKRLTMVRSASASTVVAKTRDSEDLKHNLHRLKIDFNQTITENTQLKTRNTQLENLVNTLYNDLHTQQLEIQKIYSGKSTKP